MALPDACCSSLPPTAAPFPPWGSLRRIPSKNTSVGGLVALMPFTPGFDWSTFVTHHTPSPSAARAKWPHPPKAATHCNTSHHTASHCTAPHHPLTPGRKHAVGRMHWTKTGRVCTCSLHLRLRWKFRHRSPYTRRGLGEGGRGLGEGGERVGEGWERVGEGRRG